MDADQPIVDAGRTFIDRKDVLFVPEPSVVESLPDLGRDLVRRHTYVRLATSLSARPRPDVSEHPLMEREGKWVLKESQRSEQPRLLYRPRQRLGDVLVLDLVYVGTCRDKVGDESLEVLRLDRRCAFWLGSDRSEVER